MPPTGTVLHRLPCLSPAALSSLRLVLARLGGGEELLHCAALRDEPSAVTHPNVDGGLALAIHAECCPIAVRVSSTMASSCLSPYQPKLGTKPEGWMGGRLQRFATREASRRRYDEPAMGSVRDERLSAQEADD